MKPMDEAEAYKWAAECCRRTTRTPCERWKPHHIEQLLDAIKDALLAAQDRGARSLPVVGYVAAYKANGKITGAFLDTRAGWRRRKAPGERVVALCARQPRKGGGA